MELIFIYFDIWYTMFNGVTLEGKVISSELHTWIWIIFGGFHAWAVIVAACGLKSDGVVAGISMDMMMNNASIAASIDSIEKYRK